MGWKIDRPERPESVGEPTPETLRAIAKFIDDLTIVLAALVEDDEQKATWLAFTEHDALYTWADDLENEHAEWVVKP